ncbi:MAG: hypothetical protein JNL70_13895 [Saprospiraceae bacterium]|nr:hypothetical protein [Saprospiraceae bacterium]
MSIELNNILIFRINFNVLVESKEVIRASSLVVGVMNRVECSTTNNSSPHTSNRWLTDFG